MIKLSDTINKSALTALISLMSLFAYAQAEYTEVYHGIDVSKYHGRINWKKVATDENVQFVYIKATEGADYVSPTFEQNIKEASTFTVEGAENVVYSFPLGGSWQPEGLTDEGIQ